MTTETNELTNPPPGKLWVEVDNAELRKIWDARIKSNTVFNGHTHADLIAKYGSENIIHVMGTGWFKLVSE
jgi:hypothetical protein